MNDNKIVTKATVIKTITVAIMILAFIVWQKYCRASKEDLILNGASLEEFHGRIDSVYRDKADHNSTMVVLSTGYVYGIYADWESQVTLGDSLSKSKGSLIVEVFKKDGKKIGLDYRQLVKGFKK